MTTDVRWFELNSKRLELFNEANHAKRVLKDQELYLDLASKLDFVKGQLNEFENIHGKPLIEL